MSVTRTRMFKALSALVVSMIAGAIILTGIDPGQPAQRSRPAMLLHAKADQAKANTQNNQAWDGILVRCETHSQDDHHVLIDHRGMLRPSRAWKERRPLSGHGNTMVIAMQMAERDVSPLQLSTLEKVLARAEANMTTAASNIALDCQSSDRLQVRLLRPVNHNISARQSASQ